MVAGHLQEKKGLFYIVLNFVDSDGKRKRKWIATGLPVKGNKRKAEAMLVAERQNISLLSISVQPMPICFLPTICSTGSGKSNHPWI